MKGTRGLLAKFNKSLPNLREEEDDESSLHEGDLLHESVGSFQLDGLMGQLELAVALEQEERVNRSLSRSMPMLNFDFASESEAATKKQQHLKKTTSLRTLSTSSSSLNYRLNSSSFSSISSTKDYDPNDSLVEDALKRLYTNRSARGGGVLEEEHDDEGRPPSTITTTSITRAASGSSRRPSTSSSSAIALQPSRRDSISLQSCRREGLTRSESLRNKRRPRARGGSARATRADERRSLSPPRRCSSLKETSSSASHRHNHFGTEYQVAMTVKQR